jgi:hypothetical protein
MDPKVKCSQKGKKLKGSSTEKEPKEIKTISDPLLISVPNERNPPAHFFKMAAKILPKWRQKMPRLLHGNLLVVFLLAPPTLLLLQQPVLVVLKK